MNEPWKSGASQNGAVFDLTALNPRTANRVLQHMDQEGERMYKQVVSLTRAATVGIHAVAVRSQVACIAERAAQMSPQAAEDLREIEALTHQQICNILSNDGRYKVWEDSSSFFVR